MAAKKYPRFIATTVPLIDIHCVVITDSKFWVENESEIYTWMDQFLPGGRARHEGSVITFNDPKDITSFMLRWC